jgi:hypothetical protein
MLGRQAIAVLQGELSGTAAAWSGDERRRALAPRLVKGTDETRLVVSEPPGDLAGAWNEVPEASYGVVQEGQDELRPFTPRMP